MKENDSVLQTEGEVILSLRDAIFKVKLDNGMVVDCHISGKIRKNFINILVGDRVVIEISKYDVSKGRIVFRKKV